nr:MAG TPA: hypothetical protein [Caudoviricetes sp.]
MKTKILIVPFWKEKYLPRSKYFFVTWFVPCK